MKYRKKPVEIDAILWDGIHLSPIRDFVGTALEVSISGEEEWELGIAPPKCDLFINTLEGKMHIEVGDYVIKGVKGEFYPCKPDIFKETYEPVIEIVK